MQASQVHDLYNGSTASMRVLSRMVDGATFAHFSGNNSLLEYHQEVKKMFFAALIPKAWAVAPGYQSKPNDREPVFITTPAFV